MNAEIGRDSPRPAIPARPGRSDLILSGALLVDGKASVPLLADEPAILIRDGVVAELGRRSVLLANWPTVEHHAYPGRTLMPGLIDSHVHLSLPGDGTAYEAAASVPPNIRLDLALENARRHLAAGVTTLRDLGSHADLFSLRDLALDDVPRMLLYGRPLTRPKGHMYLFGGECEGVAQVASIAESNLAMGADGIKIVASGGGTVGTVAHLPSFSEQELNAAARVAHREGKRITAHSLSIEAVNRATAAGLDGIEHLAFLDAQGQSRLTDEIGARLVDAQIAIGTTIGVNYRYIGMAEAGEVSNYELEEQRDRTDTYLTNARRLDTMGAVLLPASDSGWKHTPFGYFALELGLMHRAGIPLERVLEAATARAAQLLGLPHVGRLAPGFAADVLVLEGNPLRDADSLVRPVAVYRDGVRRV